MAKVGKERYHLTATSDGWSSTGGEISTKMLKHQGTPQTKSAPAPSPPPSRRP